MKRARHAKWKSLVQYCHEINLSKLAQEFHILSYYSKFPS